MNHIKHISLKKKSQSLLQKKSLSTRFGVVVINIEMSWVLFHSSRLELRGTDSGYKLMIWGSGGNSPRHRVPRGSAPSRVQSVEPLARGSSPKPKLISISGKTSTMHFPTKNSLMTSWWCRRRLCSITLILALIMHVTTINYLPLFYKNIFHIPIKGLQNIHLKSVH